MATTTSQAPLVSVNEQENLPAGHPAPLAASNKKSRPRKGADPINTSKQIEDTIAQLERNRAGEKDQELEIGEWQYVSVAAEAECVLIWLIYGQLTLSERYRA